MAHNTSTPANSIVILYTELAGYTITCMEALCNLYGTKIHVISSPVNKEAPFSFDSKHELISYYRRSDFDLRKINALIEQVNPFLIYCAGWNDKEYLQVVKDNKNITSLLGFDNNWTGSLKQRLSAIYARINITPYFNHAFVPGKQQSVFAKKLGFKSQHIIQGAYSANTDLYNSALKNTAHKIPHRFIFVGRYVKEKGIEELWQAFIDLQAEQENDWELWCLGVGKIEPVKHPKIKHFGFVQPNEIRSYLDQTGVFVLPSTFEPWGVVVHEFAAAGFPLLLSNAVGAKDQFLKMPENGFSFDPGNSDRIYAVLKKIISKTDEELMRMGHTSHLMAQSITPHTWAKSIYSLKK